MDSSTYAITDACLSESHALSGGRQLQVVSDIPRDGPQHLHVVAAETRHNQRIVTAEHSHWMFNIPPVGAARALHTRLAASWRQLRHSLHRKDRLFNTLACTAIQEHL
jgi:hypothetical protein